MSPASFAALTAVVAVAALTPGPAVTAIVARTLSDGLRPALAINAGVVTGDLIFLALAAAGMAAMARSANNVFLLVRLAGAAYLVWQGVQYWRAAPSAIDTVPSARHETHFWRNYGAGLLLMAGHAQAMLFYAALLPGFVDLAALTMNDFALVALMIVVVIGCVNAAYAFAAAQARQLVASARAQRIIHRIAGTLMLVAAALVLTR
jgi:threonine/homoserine/homoserine lactone efflux protein